MSNPYIKSFIPKGFNTASTSTTGSLGSHVSGDLLVLACSKQDALDNYTTPSGWTSITSGSGGSFSSIASFYKVATSSSEADPVTTHASEQYRTATTFVITGFDSTTPIDTAAANTLFASSADTTSSVTETTTVDRVMLLHLAACPLWRHLQAEPGVMGLFETETGGSLPCSIAGAWDFQETAGAIDTFEWWKTRQPFESISMVIPIRMNAGVNPARADKSQPPVVILSPGSDLRAGHLSSTEGNASTNVATIDGITTNDAGVGSDQGVGIHPSKFQRRISSTTIGQMGIKQWTFDDGPYDLSGKNVFFHPSLTAGSYVARTETLENHGLVVGLMSSTNEYAFFDAGGSDTRPNVVDVVVVNDTDSTVIHEENTFDWTDVTGFMLGLHTLATDNRASCDHVGYTDRILIQGGDSTNPASWETAYDIAQGSSVLTVDKLGDTYQAYQDVQVGNGTDVVNFATQGQILSSPPLASVAAKDVKFQASQPDLILYGVSGDTIKINDPVTNRNVTVHASSTSAATWELSAPFSGCTVSSSVDIGQISGAVFNNCTTFTDDSLDCSGGCTFTNTTVRITGATAAALQTKLDQYANCTIGRLEIASTFAGDIALELTGMTVTTLFYESTNTGSTLTATLTNTTVTATAVSDDETVSTIAPILTLSLNSDTASTLIRYFEDDSQTVVDSATGTTLDYEYPDTDPIDIEFLKQNYVPVNRQNVTPFDGDFDIVMDFDEAYNASHGLTEGTEYSLSRTGNQTVTFNQDLNAFDVYSSVADEIRTNTSFYNTRLKLVAIPGLARLDMTGGLDYTAGTMAHWKGAGMEKFHADDATNPLEKWFHIKSVGTITGGTVHYRQTDSGNSTAVTLTNNVVDEAFQYYEDVNHDGTADYDYSGYFVLKSFLAGSKQGRVDVPVNQGVSNLASNSYSVPLANAAHDYAGTDPGITADLTLITGGTEGGKVFAYEIVDGGTNTGANIAAQLNYNAATNPNTVIPGGTGLRYFELPDMVIHNATAVETERGFREGATPTQVGFYVSRGGADHPDFTRFQADDGTYYVPTVQLQATITNLPTTGNIRLQIYNNTSATEIYNADPASATYNDTYTEGGDYTAGDEIRVRFAALNAGTSFQSFETVVTATSAGWSLNANNVLVTDAVYATNGVDGSTITKFNYSAADDHFNLVVATNWSGPELFAFYCATLTTSTGIEGAFGAFEAADAGNYKNITSVASIYLDNETTATQRQTDSSRVYRDDDAYPVLDPTTSGFGIDVNWKNVVYVVSTGGSALTTTEKAQLSDAATNAATAATKSTESLKVVKNKNVTNPSTGKQQIFDDDDSTVLLEADLYQDADGTTAWDGTTGINHRSKLA